MRLRTAFAALVAFAALACGSVTGVASADENIMFTNIVNCHTASQYGSYHAYGASGYFISGCTTAKWTCPDVASRCRVRSWGGVAIDNAYRRQDNSNNGLTSNTRLRLFGITGNVYGWTDDSCAMKFSGSCYGAGTAWNTIGAGASATTECNGVRYSNGTPAKAYANCYLFVEAYRYE